MAAADRELCEHVARAVARVLPEVVAAPSTSLRIATLSGGVGQRTYRLSLARRNWAVRIADVPPQGGLDLASEGAIASAAAAEGLAPAVVGFDADTGVLVTEYLPQAHPLSPEIARRPETIDRLAALLRRLHKLSPRPRGFEPRRFTAEYLAAVGGLRALAGPDRARAIELERLARDYATRYPCITLCHNDLMGSNILDDGRLWLIDFEYAVAAAPVLDIAGLAALNGYADEERWRLAESYYANAAVPFSPAELGRVVRLVRLIGYFWALAAARGAADAARAEPYFRFAAEAGAWLN